MPANAATGFSPESRRVATTLIQELQVGEQVHLKYCEEFKARSKWSLKVIIQNFNSVAGLDYKNPGFALSSLY